MMNDYSGNLFTRYESTLQFLLTVKEGDNNNNNNSNNNNRFWLIHKKYYVNCWVEDYHL